MPGKGGSLGKVLAYHHEINCFDMDKFPEHKLSELYDNESVDRYCGEGLSEEQKLSHRLFALELLEEMDENELWLLQRKFPGEMEKLFGNKSETPLKRVV